MYRRRIIAIFLSLALVASCFAIYFYADDEEYNNVQLIVNGITYNVDNGVSIANAQILSDGSYTLNIGTIRARNGSLKPNQCLAVNFHIRVFTYYTSANFNNPISYLNPRPTGVNTYVNYANGYMKAIMFRDYSVPMLPDQTNISSYGYEASFLLTYDNPTIDLNLTGVWNNNSQATINVSFVIQEVDVSASLNWFFNSIIYPSFVGFQNSFTAIQNAVNSLNNAFVLNNSYSYQSISYDTDGNAIIQDVNNVNWVNAITGILSSIASPVIHQEEQEQLARDAGFEDVLDDAYDKSNPGSFLDLLDIGDIADWNEQSFSGLLQRELYQYHLHNFEKTNIKTRH